MRRADDFRTSVRDGVRAGRDAIVVHLAPGDGVAKVGFVVSRAVGNAVVRNRVKRRLREIVRARWDEVPAGALVVVRALPAAARTSFDSLDEQVGTALRRVRQKRAVTA